jgi:hypothetical protein
LATRSDRVLAGIERRVPPAMGLLQIIIPQAQKVFSPRLKNFARHPK